jgi:hypothetical protein
MKQFISILLSLLLLASSSGIAYAQHFCGDYEMLAKITMGPEHLTCGMKMEVPPCQDQEKEERHCCSNEYTQVDTDDNFVMASFDMEPDQYFVAAFVSVFVLLQGTDYPNNSNFYTDYAPPPLERDIQVWNQVFII